MKINKFLDKLKRIFIISKQNQVSIKINEHTLSTNNSHMIDEHDSVNIQRPNKLIIAYCFPPYVDTSGNVMAKRIRQMNDVVDVVYNKMDSVRNKDENLNKLVEDLIQTRIEIASITSFSSWKSVNEFCKLGMSVIGKKKYGEIYSRVLWPASNFLAYLYKINNPDVKWIAEFSDPILLDVHAKKRVSKIQDKKFLKNANDFIQKKFKLPQVKDNNLFFWCEYLAYIFADEIIFTNQNQLKYMLDYFPIQSIKKMVEEKAKISPHPTLSKEFYYIEKSNYKIDKNMVNIAYFGNFYSTRNLDELFISLSELDGNYRNFIRLHIFTSNPSKLKNELSSTSLNQNVYVNPFVSFNEFLNLTTMFDCLVVNDAITQGYKGINPYLPSKLSDYLGSGSPIWGIYEENSTLSEYQLDYKSRIGDITEAIGIYEQLVKKKKFEKIKD